MEQQQQSVDIEPAEEQAEEQQTIINAIKVFVKPAVFENRLE